MTRAAHVVFLPLIVVGILAGSLAVSGRAQAQTEPPETGFGDKGHFTIAADRLLGYFHASQDTTNPGTNTNTTTTNSSISVLGTPFSGLNLPSVYSFPRVGFDAFVAPSISIGGSATYFHASSSSTNLSSVTLSGFLLAPRLGFAARLAGAVWLWPRAGVTYVRLSSGSNSVYLLAATVEAPVAIALGPQAFVQIGPTVDLGLAGSSSVNNTFVPNTTNTIKETDLGLQASFVFYF